MVKLGTVEFFSSLGGGGGGRGGLIHTCFLFRVSHNNKYINYFQVTLSSELNWGARGLGAEETPILIFSFLGEK